MKECSKWKSGKRFLTAAITLSLLGSLGLYSPAAYAEEDFEEYTGSITGKEDNASEYVMAHITKDGGKNYKFTDDSLIKTNQGVKVGDLDYPVNIDASGHVLKFYGHVNDKHTLVHAVEANSKKGVTITAKKLIIDAGNTKSRAEGISVGGQNGTNKDAPYRLTINGDTDIRAHGDTYGLGMYLCGNAEVTVNGNVTMNTHDEKNPWAVYVEKDGGLSYYGGSAIYAGNNYKLQLGPKLTINGLVDLKVNANGAFANGGHSDIYLRGGNIEINKDNTKGYYALLAECATTTMNMERDENKVPVRAGSAKVTIKGNIGASAGAINVNEPETYSRTNLGLATPDSSWTGIAYNAFKDEGNEVSGTLYGSDEIIKKTFFGEINLWLQNGASWTNEAWGEPPDAYFGEDFSESHLKRLVGGESADKAGHIFQKPGEDEDSEGINIRVDDYKGFTNIYYGHKEEKPTDILGGTFTVTKAQPGSGINLITDSKGLNVDSSKAADKNLASETLNALANKLFYTAYKNGETNLAGKVEIAEGLTASSLSKRMEDVTFKKEDGQGQYLYTPATDESGQTVTEFGRAITGGTDQLYVDAGVKQADGTYKFTKDSTITIEDTVLGETYPVNTDGGNKVIIDAEGKKLTLVSKGKGLRAGIQTVLKDNKKIDITADKLIINAENTAGMSRAYGIWFSGNSSILDIHGDTKITSKANDWSYGVLLGQASKANFDGLKVSVSKEAKESAALKGTGKSVISVNVQGDTAGSNSVQLDGEVVTKYLYEEDEDGIVTTDGPSTINLALTTSDSYWNGLSAYSYKDENDGDTITKEDHGNLNLWLQNGGVWTNEKYGKTNYAGFKGSYATRLTGGSDASHAGIIIQKDEKPISVENYSGHTTVIYEHDTAAPADPNEGFVIKGGDFKIAKAAANSGITLRTDNVGLDTASDKADDKNLVSGTLNKLANKLFYTAYKNGETNLTGKVEIAEGLTASSLSKRIENVTFKESNGQGQYLYTPASDIPEEQTETAFTDTITGVKAKDMKYVNTGVRKEDGTYKFTKDSEITIAAGGPAVNVEEDVIIRADGKTLKMKTVEGSGTVYGINQSTAKKAEITAKNLDVEVTSTSRAEGIHMANSNAAIRPEMTINGNVNLKVSGTANTLGAYIQGNSRLTVNGNVTADVDGHNGGFSYYGATGLYSTSNMGPNSMGADITVNGNVDLKGKAHGIFANAGGSKVTVNGGGSIEVDKASTNPYAAIRAEDGIVNMNVKLDSSGNAVGSLDKKVNIKGNLAVTTGAVNAVDKRGTLSQINLGLTTADSTLHGVVYNAFPDEGKKAGELTFKGEANLFLANGAAWTNEKYGDTGTSWGGKNFEGSHLTKLAGGASAAKAGQIFQKDTGNITVDNYSGYTDVYYAHEETAPKTMIGGDFIIRKAASGSGISLITDNKGLNTSSEASADKNLVSETLNALANKLFYKAYADGEHNLTGFVKIAEGLTSSEAVLKTGNITFKKDNGQGRYLYTPATDEIVGPITTSEDINVTRKAEADGSVRIVWTEPNAVSGKYVSTLYSENSTSKQNPMVVDLNGHNLDLKANSAGKIAAAVYVGNNQYIHINGGVNDKLLIEATNTDTRGSNGIFLEGNSHLNIKGNVEISNVVTKGDAAAGIAFQGKDSEAVIDGTLKITDVYGKRGRGAGINASGIAVTGEKSKMTVTGPVSISGVKGSGLKTVGADTTISVGGGTIEAAEDADKSHNYYAARVEKGTININMDGNQAGKKKTNITGDMFVTGQYGKKVIEYSGGQLVDWKNAGKLNVALTDNQSSWKGAAVYDQYTSDYGTGGKTVHDVGEFNLWLQNGAVWTNERQSHGTTTTTGSAAFIGSQIAHFHGDDGDAKKSVIYQKDENPIFVNTYSGKSTIIYEHDTTAPTDPNEGFAIKGGDFKITNAAAGSDIVLRTNNAGLNTASDKAADKNLVSGTLNKLANKLYYAAYTKGEKNLSGKVEIAEGLTAQSVSMKVGDITYKDADGQGQYLYTPAKDEPAGGPIKTPEVFTQDRVAKATIADVVGSYAKKFVAAAYNSTSEKDMLVDMKGHALTLSADIGDEKVKAAGIMADGKNLSFINGKEGTPIHITARTAGEGAGIMTRSKGTVSIAHDIVIDKVEGAQMAAGVKTTNPGDKISIKSLKIDQSVKATKDTMQQGAVGINAGGNGAVVEVSDKVDIDLKGIGVRTVGGTARIAGGRIVTDTDTTKYHKALVSENSLSGDSSISMNMNEDNTAAGNQKVEILGDIKTQKSKKTGGKTGCVFLGLNSAESSWKGITDYVDDKDYDSGEVNLWLGNSATWTHEKTAATGKHLSSSVWNGSRIAALHGGSDASHAGVIIQKEKNPISVENYSGYTTVIYDHDTTVPTNPNEGLTIKGGNFKIAKAAAGSGITMRTGSKGLDTDSVKAKDKNLVNATLNALANKLFYTEFKDGKTNLTGKVEIAEGLTTSAVAKKLGDISFKSGTGQGEYIYTPEEDPIGEIIDAEGPITFNYKKDSKVFGSAVSQIGGNSKNLAYNFAGKTVNITTGGSDWAPIGMTPNVKAVINAKQLNLKTPEAGMMGTYGIYLEDGDDITVNSDVNMTVNGGAYMVDGIFMGHMGAAEAAKTKLTINGNVTMRGTGNDQSSDDFWGIKGTGEDGGYPTYMGSRWAPEGIYLGKEGGSSITINGNVDMAVKGNGAVTDAYYKVAGQNSLDNVLTLNGDVNIITPKSRERGFLALGAFGGTVNVNVKTETDAGGKVKVTGASDHKVNLVGNLYASKDDGNGDNTYYFRDGAINLGLTTSDSTWSGVVSNTNKNTPTGKSQQGDINLWLQNGATWNHEAVSRADAVYAAGNNGKTTLPSPSNGLYGAYDGISHLTTLTGGKDADHAGLIAMKDKADVEVGTYSGFSRIYYNHENSTPKQMIGGDFKVSKALDGSRITLMTGSNGLDTSSTKAADKNLVSETLNALAGKLYYLAKDGKLSAKAALAEGLTASEASLDLKNVTFKESNGQGQYLYTPASDIPEEQTETAFTDTITGVKAKDMKYVNTGVRKEDGTYKFTKDSEITIAAGGPAVNVEEDVIIRADGKTLKMKTVEGSGTVYGINQSTAKKAEITAKNLDVEVTSTSRAEGIHMANSNAAIRPEMTINGNVNLKVSGTANTLGAYIQGNSRLTVNGNVTADVDGHNGGFSYYGATGLYSTSNMGPNSMGADITVNGNVDLKGKAHGIFANAGGSKVTVNGGGSIEVDKASTNPYAAIRAEDGIVNMNVKLDSSGNAVGSLDKKVNIKGNLAVTTGAVNAVDKRGTLSQINLGLTTADSTLHGVVYNAFPDEGKKAGELTFKGEANLFLANGAAWTNEKYGDTGTSWGGKNFEGSHLTKLAGGASAAKAGQIFQKDTGNITVDNYSGYTDVYYAHEETAPKTMIGGDFIIRKAASGSGISLITDNKGLNTSSEASADKNLVSETLNALANKLFYKAYADGEHNLTGFVKIAEGLTSSEAVLKTGNITFKKDNGQGQYLYETSYPNEQITDPINKTIDGSAASEQAYKEAGVYKSDTDTYQFTKNPATINGDSGAAVDAGTKDIHVNSGANTLNLNGGNTGVGVKAEGGKTADIKGNANITGQTGVLADGAGSKVLLSGNSNITAGGDGIVASGGSIVEAAGTTNVTAGAGGKAVRAGGGSSVSLQDGKLKGDVEADNGTVSLHGAETEGNATAAAGGSINLTGGSVAGQVTAKDGNSQAIVKNATVKDLIGSHDGTASITGGIVTGTVSADDGTVKAENTKVNESVNAKNGGTVELKQGSAGSLASEGGRITANGTAVKGDASANAGGTVEMTGGSVDGAATADNGTIETENTDVANGASALNGGKLKLRNGTVSGGIKTDAASASDVVMDRAGASLQGDVSGEGKTNVTLSNGGNWKGNSAGSGETKVKVESGGTWTGASMNGDTDIDLEGKWQQTGKSKVRKLISNNGVLDKTAPESGNTDIGQLSGSLSLIYAHDKTNPTKVLGGGTFIAAADAGSTVDMITDNAGLDTNSDKAADKNKVSEVLNAMAGKLQYTGYQNGERNLKGKLRIAEGLTSSSAGLRTESLSFKGDGQGYFDYTPAKPDKPEIETGDYETSIMSSTRSALTSSILVWRNDMNDMYKRMGDLRIGAESGLWARAYGGRISYDANNAYMKDSYWAAQVGMDKRLASGWHVGGAFGYTDGSATYRYGGKGDPKLYTLAAYATRVSEDGQYVDVIAKAGKLSNKFTAYNKYSAPALRNYVEGKYDTYGYGISAEYGKKIRMGKGFVTPQAELTWSRLSSDSFDAAAPTGESMRVSQSSVNSLVGRLGVVAGVESNKGNFYAKANLFHEFDGDGHILFTEPGKTGKRSSFSLKDTWVEIALGGNYYLSPRSMIYADFTKSFGGDYKVDWRINAGIRFSF